MTKEGLQRSPIPEKPLSKETRFSDGAVVTIIRCDPVKEDGSPDPDREVEFRGETLARIGLPMPIDITFRIPEAKTLQEARSLYGKYLDLAAQERIKLMQQEMASQQKAQQDKIMVPGQAPQGIPPGMMSAISQAAKRKG